MLWHGCSESSGQQQAKEEQKEGLAQIELVRGM
jgi:hypothetical protein